MLKFGSLMAIGTLAFSGSALAGGAVIEITPAKSLAKLSKIVIKPAEAATLKDDDRVQARCSALTALITKEQKQYEFYKNEIDKRCRAAAFKEFVGDYRKIQETYGKAIEAWNGAMAKVQARLAALKKADPCTDKMSLDECIVAVEKLDKSDSELKSLLGKEKAHRDGLLKARAARVKAEQADFHKDLQRCNNLDMWGELAAKNVKRLIGENKANLAECKEKLKEIQHDNLEFLRDTSKKIAAETKLCRALGKQVWDGLVANAKREKAIKEKNCPSLSGIRVWERRVGAMLAAREKALRAMPGANAGATSAQRQEFVKAAKGLLAFKEWVGKSADAREAGAKKCSAELGLMKMWDAIADKLLKERSKDLRECNIDLAELRAQRAAAVREILD